MKLKSSRLKLRILCSTLLVIGGLVGTIPAVYYHTFQQGSVAAHGLSAAQTPAPSISSAEHVDGQPTSIFIPSLHIALPLVPGSYSSAKQDWTLTEDKAQFATPSALPNNQSGNTFVYGHNHKEIFGTLPNIKPGDKALIRTANGYVFSYRFVSTYATIPADTSILNYQGAPILTVQTCSGTYSQNRQMYQFAFVDYHKV